MRTQPQVYLGTEFKGDLAELAFYDHNTGRTWIGYCALREAGLEVIDTDEGIFIGRGLLGLGELVVSKDDNTLIVGREADEINSALRKLGWNGFLKYCVLEPLKEDYH